MQITLLRHRKPAVQLSGMAHCKDLAAIAKAYDTSGIVDRPPPETLAELRHANYVACSDLPRSVESAHELVFTQLHVADSLFCESALPYFSGTMAINGRRENVKLQLRKMVGLRNSTGW